MTKKLALLAFILVFIGNVSAATAAPKIFRFAGQAPPNSEQTQIMREMAKEIEELSNGSIEVKVYPANQLGTYTLVCEEMMRGTIDMLLGGIASEFDSRLELINVNGYASNYDDIRKLFAGDSWIVQKMSEMSAEVGIRFLAPYVDGFNGIASMKPLNEPLDPSVDKGILCRVTTMDCYALAAKAMGFRTISIPYADVYQSMQTGVCDGAVGFSAFAAYTILGDVIKYWYATNYAVECAGIMISEKTWQKCTPEEQAILTQVATKYSMLSIDNAENLDKKYLGLLKEKGIEVYTYNKDELQPLSDACRTTWETLGSRGLGKDLVKEFEAYLDSVK